MIDLMEILIGMFLTASIFYFGHFYGARAMAELALVFAVLFVLAFFLLAEIMKSVVRSSAEEEEIAEEEEVRPMSFGTIRKLTAYYVLLMFTRAFSRAFARCSEALRIEEDEDDLYE